MAYLHKIANIYFTSTSDVDARDRVRDLNGIPINLNEMRRKNMQDDGFFIFQY